MSDLIKNIKNGLLEQKREIYEVINKDYKENGLQIRYNLLEEILQNRNSFLNQENKTILAIYNGNIYIMLEVIIKSLMYNKNIILISYGEKSYTKDKVLSIVREKLKENGNKLVVKEYTDVDVKNILEQDTLVDRIIFCGDKRNYRKLKQNTNIEVKYNGYGSIMVYVDDEGEFENELIEIEEYAYTNNLYIYKFTDNIDEDIEQINEDGKNDICIILSKDENKINKFRDLVDSTYILVNEVDFNLKHQLPEELFEFIKHNPSN